MERVYAGAWAAAAQYGGRFESTHGSSRQRTVNRKNKGWAVFIIYVLDILVPVWFYFQSILTFLIFLELLFFLYKIYKFKNKNVLYSYFLWRFFNDEA